MTDLVQTSEMTSRSAWLAVGSVMALLAVTACGVALRFSLGGPRCLRERRGHDGLVPPGWHSPRCTGWRRDPRRTGRDHDLPRRGGRERGRHTCLRIGRLPLRSSRKSNMKAGVRKMKTKGATIFVTGANRGIGLAFAREALVMGAAKVYAGMRKAEGFSEPGMIPVQIDVTNPESIRHAAAQCGDVSFSSTMPASPNSCLTRSTTVLRR